MGHRFAVIKTKGILIENIWIDAYEFTYENDLDSQFYFQSIRQFSQGYYLYKKAFTLFVYSTDLEIIFDQKIGEVPLNFTNGIHSVNKTQNLRGGAKEPFVVILDFIEESWPGLAFVKTDYKDLADIIEKNGQHVHCLLSYYY